MAYPKEITDFFGDDLFRLLGPKADRRNWHSLSFKEQQARIKSIPIYISTRKLGKAPTYAQILYEVFNQLALLGDKNPLMGIDLPYYDSLGDASVELDMPILNSQLEDVSQFVNNAETQRDVFLAHILLDIVFQFQPGLVFPGIGRKDSAGNIFVNDAKHRTLGCMILGINQVPLYYIKSDEAYWDVQQYAAININSLQCSEFDRYRIRTQRARACIAAGYKVDPEDQIALDMFNVFDSMGIIVAERGDTSIGTNAKVLTGIGNMTTYWRAYGKDIATRAIQINAQMFPTSMFQTANCWGLMEFLKHQTHSSEMELDFEIHKAVKELLPRDNSGGKLHSLIKTACKEQNDISSLRWEPVVIAEGIHQLVKAYSTADLTLNDVKWPEPKERYTFALDLVQ
tara:strand:- start:296 stop:1492 length:1197 start_codon:yes stop_codon:yes gene_type:complete